MQTGSRTYKLLPAITGLFVATLLISNTIESKVFDFFGLELTAGTIVFPLAYVFGDLLTEVYGFAAARRTIWTGFAALLFMAVSYEIARHLPAVDYWQNQQAYDAVFTQVPRFVLASIIAYCCGEFMNAYILAKMKVAQKGAHMGVRFIASTIVGQGVDTLIFMLIAFAGTLGQQNLLTVILSSWLVKVLWEVIALPVTLPLVRYVKKVENEDAYDTRSDFNPFHLSADEKPAQANP